MTNKNKNEKDEKEVLEVDKISVNFNISLQMLEQIDDFLFYFKKRLPIEKRRRLTKSIFYEIGLKIAIEDFNKKGEESSFWRAINDSIK